jgi:hypothetical protein
MKGPNMVTFSNPRLEAKFDDWPLGGNRRGPCRFWFENKKGKYRVCRQTTGKPKTQTYGGKGCIVDGDDGRTYILQFAGVYDFIQVHGSDFMNANEKVVGKSGGVFPEDARYAELKALILQAH